jgi:DNA-binding XRE family transcriptional regulator
MLFRVEFLSMVEIGLQKPKRLISFSHFFHSMSGKRIVQIRQKKSITQQELTAALDYEKSNMSRLENGNTNPTIYTLLKVSNALQVELKDLFDFESL